MTTREERAEKRKALTGYGRDELLRLLLAAYIELDDLDDAIDKLSDRVCFSCLTIAHSQQQHDAAAAPPTIGGEGQAAAISDGDALPAQAERGDPLDHESSSIPLDDAALDAIFGDDA